MLDHIFKDQEKLKEICSKFKIIKLSLLDKKYYQSEIMPDHDLMLLARFEPEARFGYFEFFTAANELSALLGEGIQIDLRTEEELRAYHRQEMLDSAVVQYAA